MPSDRSPDYSQPKPKSGKPISAVAQTPAENLDAVRLVHELQVHQVELEMQNAELRESRAEAESARQRYRDLYEFAPVAYLTLTRDGKIVELNLAAAKLLGAGRASLVGASFGFFVAPSSRSAFVALLDAACAGREGQTCEVTIVRTGSPVTIASMSAARSTTGDTCRAVLLDITQRKQDEASRRLLMNELDHRVKNNLAVIMSLAQQTISSAGSLQEFEHQFLARLFAMKRVHEALAHSHWQQIGLYETAHMSLEAYVLSGQVEIGRESPKFLIGPNAAMTLSMALFELQTNAVKYGALSTTQGRVNCSWVLAADEAHHDRVTLQWKESGGPPVQPPRREGFGTMLIRDNLAHNLRASPILNFHQSGFCYEVSIPVDSLVHDT